MENNIETVYDEAEQQIEIEYEEEPYLLTDVSRYDLAEFIPWRYTDGKVLMPISLVGGWTGPPIVTKEWVDIFELDLDQFDIEDYAIAHKNKWERVEE